MICPLTNKRGVTKPGTLRGTVTRLAMGRRWWAMESITRASLGLKQKRRQAHGLLQHGSLLLRLPSSTLMRAVEHLGMPDIHNTMLQICKQTLFANDDHPPGW